jgi:2-keto-4-pentenoate hydratase/2-oxohepta-3-ene-1,7-dioic acid hydratase in catechol pathway
MKLASYRLNNQDSYGVVVGDGVIDLAKRLPQKDLKSLLQAGGLAKVAEAIKGAKADAKLSEVSLLPVIPNPEKILCVGLNYKAHREETGRKETDNPAIFVRFPDSQTPHQGPIVKPKTSDQLDYEGELAVIIGKTARHVQPADALKYIAGYSIYHDGSVRDWQYHTMQWTPGKNYPKTGGFGPWMVTTDDIPDPSKLHLQTRLNGKVMQDSDVDLLIWDIPTLIKYITTFTELHAGDVISTGTPGGVGSKRTPPVWMKAGDKAEIEISGIGVLENTIVNE